MRRTLLTGGVVALLSVVTAAEGSLAQEPGNARDSYYRAVAGYFRVTPDEVAILGEWDLSPDEVPVVLFVARRAGVPPDVVVAVRQSGVTWDEVARRHGLSAGAFYLPFADGAQGSLASAYGAFGEVPETDWSGIRLEDGDIVSLVNLRVISQDLSVSLSAVIAARDRRGDFVVGYEELNRERR
jgi:hypothetical protein